MAINSIFNKIKESTSSVGGSVSGVVIEKINASKDNFNSNGLNRNIRTVRKEISDNKSELSKLMSVIGRETFELYEKKELSFDSIESYLEKASSISKHISILEVEKDNLEKTTLAYNTCQCGEKLSKNIKYCPQCGSSIDDLLITCSCKKTHSINATFCLDCGDNLQEIYNNQQNSKISEDIECVCGSFISKDSSICMECGRLNDNC